MGLIKAPKQFTSPRYVWLVKNKESDPKLQKLFDELEQYWNKYKLASYELDYYFERSKPRAPINTDTPWDA